SAPSPMPVFAPPVVLLASADSPTAVTPLPVAESFDALNARLLDACTKRRRAVLRGHGATIAERMQADLAALMKLPAGAHDACDKATTRVSSLSLVRYKNNDYSVPARYGHQEVLAKGYVDRVEIVCRDETIAVHPRSYEKADFIYNPLHYLALLEHKTKALDQAAPLDDWRLADCIHRLRRLMEARMGTAGRREFIQVLRLMEDFHQHQVEEAVSEALRLGAISFDAVKMLLLARLENRPARLDLTLYPYLPAATIGTTDPRPYLALIAGSGSVAGGTGMTMSQETRTPTIVAPKVLLSNHLKALKLPTFVREYEKVAMESAQDRADYPRFLLRLCEFERIDRERRNVERRIRLARFPQTKGFDTFDFAAQPSLNKALVLELIRCEWIDRRQNCIALGPSGTGKTHLALGLGLAACQKGYNVAFTTAAALVHELMEARDERRLRALQKHLNTVKLLIVDELGYVPFTAVGPSSSSRFSANAMSGAQQLSAVRRMDVHIRIRAAHRRI